MFIEIILTSVIILLAIYMFVKAIKKKSQGKCECSCGQCANYCNCHVDKKE